MMNFEDVQDCIDTIVAMKCQEKSYTCYDYLETQVEKTNNGLNVNVNANAVDEDSRSKMVQWCYQTVDYFKLSRNSAYVGMSCLDRFLCTPQGRPFLADKALYQLACIASLQMAIKVHEPVELGLCLLVELCRGAYSEEQIIKTEEIILNAIQWKVNPPSPKSFVQRFIAMMPNHIDADTRSDLLELACYQTEVALSHYKYSALTLPSSVAFASLMNALSMCPEISPSTKSQFFRTLGKTTGCTRYLDSVKEVKEFLHGQIQLYRQVKEVTTTSSMDCSSTSSCNYDNTASSCQSSCAVNAQSRNVSPVTTVA